ncbi:DUF3710 domain-containing protein [Pseudonocardia sediminis]|nr:DUF3710 domain-containing protein [Pseudonocardia sediminis]
MFDVRPETGTGDEELYPGYPGYGEPAEPGDVYDDHDSRERESARVRGAGPSGTGRARAVAPARGRTDVNGRTGAAPADPRGGAPRGGPGPDGRWDESEPPLYGGRPAAARDDRYDDEPLYARDYAPQGHDFGDPDDDPRDRPPNGRAPVRPEPPAPVPDDEYDDDYEDEDYDDEGYDEEDYDDDEYGVGDAPLSVPPPGRDGRPLGPADVEELDPSMTDALARVDLGSMQVPVPYGAELKLEPTDGGRPQAVHLMLPEGRIAVSALAAPRSSGLWHELSAEIETSLRNGGARVRNAQGDWGRELHARTENAASVFIGADGPRWMVYGVATASLDTVDALDVELRRVMRGVIVVRGKLPYPPRTVLPLTLPEHLAEKQPEAAKPKGASITVSVPAGSTTTGATPRPGATGSTPAPAPSGAPVAPAAVARPNGAPVREPAAARAEGDPVASTRSIPQVARPVRRDPDAPVRRPVERRPADGPDAPTTRTGAAPRVRRESAAPVAGTRPPGRDAYEPAAGPAAATGRLSVPPREGAVPPREGAVPPREGAVPSRDGAVPSRDGAGRPADVRDDGYRSGPADDRRGASADRYDDGYPDDRYADGDDGGRFADDRYPDDRFADDRRADDPVAGRSATGRPGARGDAARTGGYRSRGPADRPGSAPDRREPASSGSYRAERRDPALLSDPVRRDPATSGWNRAVEVPDEPVRSGGFDAVPEPVEPPVRRDPAVTALSPADLVPDPASLRSSTSRSSTSRSGTSRSGTSRSGTDRSGEPPRRRRADRPRGGRDLTPAADLLRDAGEPAPGPDRWSPADDATPLEPGTPLEPTPLEPTSPELTVPGRMAIEDIPLVDVPLLDAELDAEPLPEPPLVEPSLTEPSRTEPPHTEAFADPVAAALPRRRPRAGTNGASRPAPGAGPDTAAGGRRRRGDAEAVDRPADASPWMSAEIAARPGGRHARPGGHRDPDATTRSPLDPEPPRNGSRVPLTDWRDTSAYRGSGHDADGGDLFSSPAEAGERYRRNGNGHHPDADGGGPAPGDDPTGPASAVDPGRHRR